MRLWIVEAFGAPPGTQHLRRLARKSSKQNLAIHAFREMPGKGCLASSGITEKPENLSVSGFKPFGDCGKRA